MYPDSRHSHEDNSAGIFRPLDNESDYFHGLLSQAATKSGIAEVVAQFAQGGRMRREAGLDGVELHGATDT